MSDTGIPSAPPGATGLLLLSDGRAIWGRGFGAEGVRVGELCFNTAMTGYQEVMTDPSYAGQLIAFTFPHIGNVGANDEDAEADHAHALGCITREDVTDPSNFRQTERFDAWMQGEGLIGLSGVDTSFRKRRQNHRWVRFAGVKISDLLADEQPFKPVPLDHLVQPAL